MPNDRPTVTADEVARAARRLRADEREALRLHAGEGLSVPEIASALGIAEDEVVPLLARAILRLERALEARRHPWWRFW